MATHTEPSQDNFTEISRRYNLGNIVKEPRLEAGGKANYNYAVETERGTYMIRVSQEKDEAGKKRKELEYAFTDYLHESDFPYNTPLFLQNDEGNRVTTLGTHNFEVYERLPGEVHKTFDESSYRQLAQALGNLHKYAQEFPAGAYDSEHEASVRNWLLQHYQEMRQLEPNTKTNTLILDNVDFFEDALSYTEDVDWHRNRQVVHGDLTDANVLFEDGTLTGIIDFDSINVHPRAKDVADSINRTNFLGRGYSEEKENIFVDEYAKVHNLSQEEIDALVPLTIRGDCIFFYWGNMRLEKSKDDMYDTTQHLVKNTKGLVDIVQSRERV